MFRMTEDFVGEEIDYDKGKEFKAGDPAKRFGAGFDYSIGFGSLGRMRDI